MCKAADLANMSQNPNTESNEINGSNVNLYCRRLYSGEGLVFDSTCHMYWGHVTQEGCKPCQLLPHTPSQSATSATSLLIVGLLWGIWLDSLSGEQQNQLNREIRCINKQCCAWGRPGMTRWHSHLDITLQLPPRAISADQCCKALIHWLTHIPNDYIWAFK